MIYKNAELYNVEHITENDDGSISWLRAPKKVYNSIESANGKNMLRGSTGVEIRFKLNSEKVRIRMSVSEGDGVFHIYRGAIQGGWEDHEVHKHVTTQAEDFIIERSNFPERLKMMTEKSDSEWNSEIIRIIFDRGTFKIFDIDGDIEPPQKDDCPSKTLMCYGSSITHGSNSIDTSHSWASLLAHSLNCDLKNKGMAGSCYMERDFVDYIAEEGRKGNWDFLTLELGINVIEWDEKKIYERAENTISVITEANPDKSIFVISPFYHLGDDLNKNDGAKLWRKALKEIVSKHNYPNVTYINGLDILGDMTGISADFVHPNIYGVAQIADRLIKIIKPALCR